MSLKTDIEYVKLNLEKVDNLRKFEGLSTLSDGSKCLKFSMKPEFYDDSSLRQNLIDTVKKVLSNLNLEREYSVYCGVTSHSWGRSLVHDLTVELKLTEDEKLDRLNTKKDRFLKNPSINISAYFGSLGSFKKKSSDVDFQSDIDNLFDTYNHFLSRAVTDKRLQYTAPYIWVQGIGGVRIDPKGDWKSLDTTRNIKDSYIVWEDDGCLGYSFDETSQQFTKVVPIDIKSVVQKISDVVFSET